MRTLAFLAIAASGIFAQSPAPRPNFDAFEVATIKLTPPDWSGGRYIRMQTAHQLEARNNAVKTLIAAAYNLNPNAISRGPEWIDSDRYDILAKAPGESRPNLDKQMSMLRALLVDRFKLTFHREPKELPIYTLTVVKSGLKIKETTMLPDQAPEGPPPLVFVVTLPSLRMPARYATMAEFASMLQRAALDRPVVDKTGLSGRYDFDLEFTADDHIYGGALGKGTDDATKPGLFAAIQEQLGLKLEATRGTIQAMVIDRVERPSEN
jgi:uncharacterized protein (TIGR03435 family)